MSDWTDKPESEISQLRKRYQAIEAPAHVRTRIRAHARDQQTRIRHWRPAFVAIPLAIAVLGILPFVGQKTTETNTPKLPSMAALSELMPSRPTSVSPSLGRLRTVSAPPMPRKPKTTTGNDPQSGIAPDIINRIEEQYHDYV